MSWSPDTGIGLTSGCISITNVEQSANRIWREYLYGWFDGASHTLRTGVTQTFPAAAKITLEEQVLPNTLEGFYITLTHDQASRSTMRQLWNGETFNISERVRLNFWLRARVKTARADGQNAVSLVRNGADLLFALLAGVNTTTVLQRRGMWHFKPQRGQLVSGATMAMRLVPLLVTYTYPSEATPELPLDGGSNYSLDGGYLQFINSDDSTWYCVSVFGPSGYMQFGLQEGAATGSTYRETGGYFELYNSDTSTWVALLCANDPPQFTPVEHDELTAGGTHYRFNTNGLQIENTSTGLFHTVGTAGTPPQFTMSLDGEA